MFIGHYGVALAAKRVTPQTSLGVLFVAVQLLDFVFMLLVLAGVEKARIVPGFTQSNAYDLYFMPYSHSLAGSVFWSALAALAFGLAMGGAAGTKERRARVVGALVIGAAVLSHFVLDLPMHVPDLALGFDADSPKVGLGLWNQVDVTIALELGVLVAGGALYAGITVPRSGKAGVTLFIGALLLALAMATPFLPPQVDANAFAAQGLGALILLAIAAEWMDRSREGVAA
jgi:hypothetical protein